MDYYTNADSLNEALLLADKALAVDSDNELFMLAKSTVLLNIGKYDDCISLSDSLIQKMTRFLSRILMPVRLI